MKMTQPLTVTLPGTYQLLILNERTMNGQTDALRDRGNVTKTTLLFLPQHTSSTHGLKIEGRLGLLQLLAKVDIQHTSKYCINMQQFLSF
jgi:hypothetical protein